MPSFHSCIVKIRYIGRSCCTKKQLLRHSLILLHCLDYLFWTQGMHAVVSGAQRAWFWTPSGSCFSTIRRRARLWMSALRKVRWNAYIDVWFRKARAPFCFTNNPAFPGCFTNNKIENRSHFGSGVALLFSSILISYILRSFRFAYRVFVILDVATRYRHPTACRCVATGFGRY